MSATPDHGVPHDHDGRPKVFRNGTVLTMDDSKTILKDADVPVGVVALPRVPRLRQPPYAPVGHARLPDGVRRHR